MSSKLKNFIDNLIASGIMSQLEVNQFISTDIETIDTAEELAKKLVDAKRLTRYQARVIYQGKTHGLVLDRYIIQSPIGRGGMGTVFKAIHSKLKRNVAIKVLSSELARSKDAVRRFKREVVAAAELKHPNIVQAFDACQHNDIHFLVMELIEGSDLSKRVKEHGALSPSKAVDYILQAARGLAFAHDKGIIHRDIKPHNMLVGSDDVLKVSDMGLARMKREGDTEHSLTTTGQVFGTIDFMAPEQASDTHAADERSDIYSLGCSLCYLLTGRPPFDGGSYVSKIMSHIEKPIPTLSEVNPIIPNELDEVFQRCLAKEPTDRYRSMAELIEDLEAIRSSGKLTDGNADTSLDMFAVDLLSSDLDLGELDSEASPSFLKSKRAGRSNKLDLFGLPLPIAVAGGSVIGIIAILILVLIVSSFFERGESVVAHQNGQDNLTEMVPDLPEPTDKTLLQSSAAEVETSDSITKPAPAKESEPESLQVTTSTADESSPLESIFGKLTQIEWNGDVFTPAFKGAIYADTKIVDTNITSGEPLTGLAFDSDGRLVIAQGRGGAGERRIAYWSEEGRNELAVPLEFVAKQDIDYTQGRFDFFNGPVAFDKNGTCYFAFGSRNPSKVFRVQSQNPLQIEELFTTNGSTYIPRNILCAPHDTDALYTLNVLVQSIRRYDLKQPSSPPKDYLNLKFDAPLKPRGIDSAIFLTPTRILLCLRDMEKNKRVILLVDEDARQYQIIDFGYDITTPVRMAATVDMQRFVMSDDYGKQLIEFDFAELHKHTMEPDTKVQPDLQSQSNAIGFDVARVSTISNNMSGLPNINIGDHLAAIGDWDGDGVQDFASGDTKGMSSQRGGIASVFSDGKTIHQSPRGFLPAGIVHLISMNSDGSVKQCQTIRSDINGCPTLKVSSMFGFAVTSLGDLDGDHIPDLAIGAPADGATPESSIGQGGPCGSVYILLMNRNGSVKQFNKIAPAPESQQNFIKDLHFGRSLATIGDINQDGTPDLAVGSGLAPTHTMGSVSGALYILMLNRDGTVKQCQVIDAQHGNGPILAKNSCFGLSATPLGDLDSDGVPDLAVGAAYSFNGDEFVIYILFMNTNGTVKKYEQISCSMFLPATYRFNGAISSLGDLDGNKTPDLLIGCISNKQGEFGQIFALFLNTDGTVRESKLVAKGPSVSFGRSLAVLDDSNQGMLNYVVTDSLAKGGGISQQAVHVMSLTLKQDDVQLPKNDQNKAIAEPPSLLSLDTEVKIDVSDTPFSSILDSLAKQTGVTFYLDNHELDKIRFTPSQSTSITMQALLSKVLDQLVALSDNAIGWVQLDDTILITSHEALREEYLETRVYLTSQNRTGATGIANSIMQLEPVSWLNNGGSGQISHYGNNAIIICQSPDILDSIESRFNSQCRKVHLDKSLLDKLPLIPNTEQIFLKLDKRIIIDSPMSLNDTMKSLEQQLDLTVNIDETSIQADCGCNSDVRLSTGIDNMRGATALDLLLREIACSWTISEGNLLVTSEKAAQNELIEMSYPISSLMRINGSDGDLLIEALESGVSPKIWLKYGGQATCRINSRGDQILLNAPLPAHQTVRKMIVLLYQASSGNIGSSIADTVRTNGGAYGSGGFFGEESHGTTGTSGAYGSREGYGNTGTGGQPGVLVRPGSTGRVTPGGGARGYLPNGMPVPRRN